MLQYIPLEKPTYCYQQITVSKYVSQNSYYKLNQEKTNLKPAVVYEFTGVYALPLLSFFIEDDFKIYQISHLESAKMRKAELRPVKNDSLDTNTIAKVYYTKELKEFSKQEKAYEELKEMSRHYQSLIYQSNDIIAV